MIGAHLVALVAAVIGARLVAAHEGAVVVAHGLAARGAGGDHRAQSDPQGRGRTRAVVLMAAITGRTGWRRTGWWWR